MIKYFAIFFACFALAYFLVENNSADYAKATPFKRKTSSVAEVVEPGQPIKAQ